MTRPIVLSAHAGTRCARRAHNEHDATLRTEVVAAGAAGPLQARIEAGLAFEADVMDALVAALGPDRCADLRAVEGRAALVAATTAALDAGRDVVLGGWLPDDVEGGRSGRPDLLLRVGTRGDRPAYLPGEVKGHKVLAGAHDATAWLAPLTAPGEPRPYAGLVFRHQRSRDLLQVAHYWRMLEAAGRTPEGITPTGVVVGTDEPAGPGTGPVLVWHDLTAATMTTYSRSQGRRRRSPLERHDHEHGFRRLVAETAAARTGAPDDPAPLVRPIFVRECDTCPWLETCLDVAGPDDPSAALRTLSVREWNALRGCGVVTLDDVADLDLDDAAFAAAYLPEVTHVDDPRGRLELAVRRARMLRAGVQLDRLRTGPVDLPRGDVEIDLDTEWGADNLVYLWGALAPEGFVPFVSWADLDADAERALAAQFADWLRARAASAAAQGRSVRVYHYTAVEPKQLARVLGADAVADLLPLFVDLYPHVREQFVGLHGLGLKQVAPQFGFAWRDDDPGGLQSQVWLEQARSATDPGEADDVRRRILDYNEDDVRATAALRAGLAGLT